jgi:hypothetical protein
MIGMMHMEQLYGLPKGGKRHKGTTMTKTEARAILACQKALGKALKICEGKLKGDELQYAQQYWMGQIYVIIGGFYYGSMPIESALAVLEPQTD